MSKVWLRGLVRFTERAAMTFGALWPNPSIERTVKSWPRYSTTSFLLPRGQLSSAAHVER